MNIEFTLKQTDTLVNDFNQIASDEIIEREKYQTRYNDNTTIEKLSKWRNEKVTSILNKLKTISVDVDNEIRKEAKKIPSVKFPLRFSVLSSDKTLGELMRSNAFQFISLVKDKNSIVNEINSAFQTEQIDYANNLIEIIELNKPNEVDLSKATKEDREFYKAVENRRKEFELKYSLTNTNESLGKLELLKLELQFILNRIEANDPLIVPMRKFFEIDNEKDRAKFTGQNLEALNISNAFFTKHNAIIKYKLLEQKGVPL